MLIRPNDLRIGNYLCDKFNQLIIVQEIRSNAIVCVLLIPSEHDNQVFLNALSNTLMDYNSLYPMELNDFILGNMEFKYAQSNDSETEYEYSGFRITLNKANNTFSYKLGAEIIELKYLHDLQNLFYTIKKQDLSLPIFQ